MSRHTESNTALIYGVIQYLKKKNEFDAKYSTFVDVNIVIFVKEHLLIRALLRLSDFRGHITSYRSVSYTHLTLPTNREV